MNSLLNSDILYILKVISTFIIFLALVYFIIYNGLINKKNRVKNAFSSIDIMLKKRHDLLPNLIATVKQFMKHEKEIFTEITKLRSQIIDSNQLSKSKRVNLEDKLTNTLNTLKINIENYPELKSDKSFLLLQKSFNEVEAQLSASRRAYNASVLALNNAIEMFPTSIIAKRMKLEKENFFEATEIEKNNVSFNEQ